VTAKLAFSALFTCLAAAAQTAPIPEWHIGGSNPKPYEFDVDRDTFHTGHASAMIHCRQRRCPAFATLMQTIQSDEYQGRRVRLSGWVKATKGVSARLWMRVDGDSGEILAFDNMDNRSKNGPFEWTRQEIVLDVIPPAALINYGLIVDGGGTGWVDDLVLEVVERKIKSTNMMQGPGPPAGSREAVRKTYYASKSRPANLDFEQPPGLPGRL
jgi:AraC family transcriptional regulator